MPEVVFNVEMACGGCSGACTRILKKVEGVSNIDANLETQKIKVEYASPATPEVMLEKLQVWGKNANKAVSMAESSSFETPSATPERTDGERLSLGVATAPSSSGLVVAASPLIPWGLESGAVVSVEIDTSVAKVAQVRVEVRILLLEHKRQ
eukprot:CAMPEP_0197392624 /NCGR_PEP_ID=MMETSP1165-20131217/3829_1 /TAXON_ID=284809 /ORGANISM="Chrysocystis fragilis, Strain CCMP3189" /LENGTH=151 /DNA_ID=CAMNT_0042918255 /DNA_START=110 /DNA_END=564 /DNA_ORIENTATION=-